MYIYGVSFNKKNRGSDMSNEGGSNAECEEREAV